MNRRSRKRNNKKKRLFYTGLALCALVLVGIGASEDIGVSATRNPKHQVQAPVHHAPITVVTVGGSVARGWKDEGWEDWEKGWYGGYLTRAFHQLSQATKVPFVIRNHTIVGANSSQLDTMYKGQYRAWLTQDKPQVIVISWGLLNDARPKTPLSVFSSKIHDEIAEALSHHAVVYLVTPPATEESYTDYKVQEETYADSEMQVAKTFHSNRVQVFDVFHEMKDYIAAHHQSIQLYKGNSWHPNRKGHILAGQLLFQDMQSQFNENSTNPLYTSNQQSS